MATTKPIDIWDIDDIEERLDQYSAFLDEGNLSQKNGVELFHIARRAAIIFRSRELNDAR